MATTNKEIEQHNLLVRFAKLIETEGQEFYERNIELFNDAFKALKDKEPRPEQKLTNYEIATVYAMYQNATVVNPKHPDTIISYDNTMEDWFNASAYAKEHDKDFWNNRRLALYTEIKDEDAITACYWGEGVCGYRYTAIADIETIKSWNNGSIEKVLETGRRIAHCKCLEDVYLYLFLVSKMNAVPLWFGPNHWANGKTAIELGIAIVHPKQKR